MEEICSLHTSISENAFWSIVDQWAQNPQHLMKPVKLYQLISKKYYDKNNNVILSSSFNESNEEINGIPHDLTQHSHVSYERHLIPRLKEKDNEIDEVVTLDFVHKRVKFYPLFPSSSSSSSSSSSDSNENNNNESNNTNSPDPSYLPFFYPKVLDFTITYEPLPDDVIAANQQNINNNNNTTEEKIENKNENNNKKNNNKGKKNNNNNNKTEEPPKPNIANLVLRATFFDNQLYRNTMKKVGKEVIEKMIKWGTRTDSGGYEKHAHYDKVVPRHIYLEVYERIKPKYKHWAEQEGEASDDEEQDPNKRKGKGKKGSLWRDAHGGLDPQKYVYEEIGIAAYLIALWEIERKEKNIEKKQRFVDVGCGNGFLVNILILEGYDGFGVDLRARKIWALYSPEVRDKLIEEAIMPNDVAYEVDWVVANHSDELTPWTPFIASKISGARFFVIPCCFYDFGCKFNRNDTRIGQYKTYLNYVEKLSGVCGFKVERETLRIPSTKNIALIGRERTSNDQSQLEIERKKLLEESGYSAFVPRPKIQPWVPPKRIKPNNLQQQTTQEKENNTNE